MRTEEAMMPRAQIRDERTYQEFPGSFGAVVQANVVAAHG
jgi:hypothetical protein